MRSVDDTILQKLMGDLGDDPTAMRELIGMFLHEAPKALDEMRRALPPRDARALAGAAHSLKSTAATFGASRLSRLCRDLERVSEPELPPDADARVMGIEAEWGDVSRELASWRG